MPMPIEPIGARPSSTLSPESRPASISRRRSQSLRLAFSTPIHRPSQVENLRAEENGHQLQQRSRGTRSTKSRAPSSHSTRSPPQPFHPVDDLAARIPVEPGARRRGGTLGIEKLVSVPSHGDAHNQDAEQP